MLMFFFFVYLPEIHTSLSKRLCLILSVLTPKLSIYTSLLARTVLIISKILTFQPPHLALCLRLRVDEVHLEVLKHGIALMTWQPPRLRWLARSCLPEWPERINVPEDDDDSGKQKEDGRKAEVEKVGKQQTVAEAATIAEKAQEMKYTDPIQAVLLFLPSHEDVKSLLKVFWRFHFAMLNTGRPQKLKEKVERTVKKTVEETVDGVADLRWRAEGVAEVMVEGMTISARAFGDLHGDEGAGTGKVNMEELESKQVRVEDACEDCPGCYDGSGCVHRRYSPDHDHRYGKEYEYEYYDESDSDTSSDTNSTFSSECGSHSSAPSSFSSASTISNHASTPQQSSPTSTSNPWFQKPTIRPSLAKPSSTKSSSQRTNSFGRLRSYNTPILPSPSTTKPIWAQTPSERRKDPADFSDAYLRQTYRRRVGRDVKEGRGVEWHYSDQSRTSLRPSWESL